jgi:hypothetical protein
MAVRFGFAQVHTHLLFNVAFSRIVCGVYTGGTVNNSFLLSQERVDVRIVVVAALGSVSVCVACTWCQNG